MKNSMIKRILDCLKAKQEAGELRDYSLVINNVKSVEEFFVIQKLETTRIAETSEGSVTVYKDLGNGLLGSSSFVISHELSKNEIKGLIEEALFSASYVKNKTYELVTGEKKIKKVKKIEAGIEPFALLQDCALSFFKASVDDKEKSVKFNSLELFFKEADVRLINSKGVDYEKKTYSVNIEAIPSYTDKKTNFKTELYRMYEYKDIDAKLPEKAFEDANEAVSDCLLRAYAKQNDGKKNLSVIIRNKDIASLLEEVIGTYNYSSVYNKSNMHSVGDDIQAKPLNKLSIKLCKSSKEDFFDNDGTIINDFDLIKDGKLVNYFGNNRFASYLGQKCNGMPGLMKVKEGKKSIDDLTNREYIEIIALSGIQVDAFQGFLGGEIRLAKYCNGKETYPISGLSFSTDLKNALNNFEFSKETTSIKGYVGPKYMMINDVEIN